MKYQDYYKLLGVDRSASQKELAEAYRSLVRKYHPDVSKEPDAEEKFKQINEAYEVLKDPEKRKRYDQLGPNWKHGQDFKPPQGYQRRGRVRDFNMQDMFGAEGGADFSDFFSQFFGFGRSAGGPDTVSRKGRDLQVQVFLSVEEACVGVKRELSLKDPTTGSQKNITVKVPAGVTDGSKVRLAGQGGPGVEGGPAGDLFLLVKLNRHPYFEVRNRDVYLDLPVTVSEAALGAEVTIPTPDGSRQNVKVPPGTSSGTKLRFRGRGLPSPKGKPGNLFAVVKIAMPDKLTAEQKKLYKKLSEISSLRPRPW
ncbi:MAG: DnaJ C-terminal domain-containing protein [Planctomycetota bacterium]|nr:DnaJ C-terminal domain-containing protein [Planctomycetota bacterium]